MERLSHSSSKVMGAMAVTLILAFALALYIHGHFTTYRAHAVYHLPSKIESAVWLNVEQNIGFDVFERAILPTLEVGRTEHEPRIKHLERKTTLDLVVDTREFVFAHVSNDKWLIVLGGLYRRTGVLPGVVRMLEEEGVTAKEQNGLVVTADGHAFGVAEDAVLIVSNSEVVARTALVSSAEGKAWKTLLNKPGSMLNFLAYQPDSDFWGKALFVTGAERWWLSLEPGDRLPVFLERIGGGEGLPVPGILPFDIQGLSKVSQSARISSFTGQVQKDLFWQEITNWAPKLHSAIW